VTYGIDTLKDNKKAAYLQSVIQNYRDYIIDATKQPITSSDSTPDLPLITHEEMEVSELCRSKLVVE
jgi:hypothetical protein